MKTSLFDSFYEASSMKSKQTSERREKCKLESWSQTPRWVRDDIAKCGNVIWQTPEYWTTVRKLSIVLVIVIWENPLIVMTCMNLNNIVSLNIVSLRGKMSHRSSRWLQISSLAVHFKSAVRALHSGFDLWDADSAVCHGHSTGSMYLW